MLISSGTFLHRGDFTGRFIHHGTSLADGIPVSLSDTVTGLDWHNTRNLGSAIRHASGHLAIHAT